MYYAPRYKSYAHGPAFAQTTPRFPLTEQSTKMLAVTTLATLALSTTALGAAVQRRDVSYSVTGGTQVPIKDPAPVAIS
jgi:hypothetical protein